MPIKVANSSLLFGSGMSTIASTRSGLGSTPFDEKYDLYIYMFNIPVIRP